MTAAGGAGLTTRHCEARSAEAIHARRIARWIASLCSQRRLAGGRLQRRTGEPLAGGGWSLRRKRVARRKLLCKRSALARHCEARSAEAIHARRIARWIASLCSQRRLAGGRLQRRTGEPLAGGGWSLRRKRVARRKLLCKRSALARHCEARSAEAIHVRSEE